MNFIFVIVTLLIIAIFFFNYLTYRHKKDTYLKAGKKWEEIVNELSKRK